jgi:5-methyltetrahydropteroyltriglutamate--homocysteine methyltransferase
MLRSDDHIISTHVGSLPRPRDLLPLLEGHERGEPLDEGELSSNIGRAVDEVVDRQVTCGIEVVNDGEMGKTSFLAYVNGRLGGFEPIKDSAVSPWAGSREERAFPEFLPRVPVAVRPQRFTWRALTTSPTRGTKR